MKLRDFLKEHEEIVVENSEKKSEFACEFLPVADWYLLQTNHGRCFTCKDDFKKSEENVGKNWEDVEFASIHEGRVNPF